MTKEELIKFSRENLRKSKQGSLCECYDEAFIKGYQLSEKRIAELEAQIKKMRCCGNCKYYQFQNDAGYRTCTRDGKRNGKNYRSCEFNLEKWEGR